MSGLGTIKICQAYAPMPECTERIYIYYYMILFSKPYRQIHRKHAAKIQRLVSFILLYIFHLTFILVIYTFCG